MKMPQNIHHTTQRLVLVNNQFDALFNAFQAVTYTERYMPDDVLIQLILLMMSTGFLETCREVK
jgi:hypothetical protein